MFYVLSRFSFNFFVQKKATTANRTSRTIFSFISYFSRQLWQGMAHIWRPWKLSNFQDRHLLSIYVQNSSTPLTLDIQCLTKPPFSRWYRACKQKKPKQKQNQVTWHSNWPLVLLFDLAHKQYIKYNSWKVDFNVWRHSQKEDFLSITY